MKANIYKFFAKFLAFPLTFTVAATVGIISGVLNTLTGNALYQKMYESSRERYMQTYQEGSTFGKRVFTLFTSLIFSPIVFPIIVIQVSSEIIKDVNEYIDETVEGYLNQSDNEAEYHERAPAYQPPNAMQWQAHDHLRHQGHVPSGPSQRMNARQLEQFMDEYNESTMLTDVLTEAEIAQYKKSPSKEIEDEFGDIDGLINGSVSMDRIKTPATIYKVYTVNNEEIIVPQSEHCYDISTIKSTFANRAIDPLTNEVINAPKPCNGHKTTFRCRLGYSKELADFFRRVKQYLSNGASNSASSTNTTPIPSIAASRHSVFSSRDTSSSETHSSPEASSAWCQP